MDGYPRTETISPLMPTVITSQKLVKCRKFANSEDVPLCYTENSAKEELVLEHVKDYERQFYLIYGSAVQTKLLLYPPNECGVEKFICTTLRPTQMPFSSLYEWDACAEFVADFLQYEELSPPNEQPQCIPSPTNVLKWQYGDCYDFGMALTSLLIGAGYDAYCVQGRAPREITTRDQTRMICPLQIKEAEMPDTDSLPEMNDDDEFTIRPKPPIISKFITKREKDLTEEEQRRIMLENTIDDDAPEFLPPDQWAGQRLHCWVLVLEGKRSIESSFFLEPTTGRRYELEESLYENIDFLWNDYNFWIHMHPNKPVQDINFDLNNDEEWEYVMLDPTKLDGDKDDHDDEQEEAAADDNKIVVDEMGSDGLVKEIDHVLDLPPPWPPKLRIDRDVFARKCPLGEKSVFYEKCRFDVFADYTQYDGLTTKVTYYEDFKRHLVKEMRWIYSRRADKLVIKRRFPANYQTIEDYAAGGQHHWKQIVSIDGKSRLFIYYHTRNQDGLIRREEKFGKKFKEYFHDRDDYMVFRAWSIVYRESNTKDYTLGEGVVVTKMTQRFDKNPNLPVGKKISKVVYDMNKKKVYVYYHYEPGSIIREVKEFNREDFTNIGKVQDGQEREEHDEMKQQELQELQAISDMEKACYSGIKTQEAQLKTEMKTHKNMLKEWDKLRKHNDTEIALAKSYISKSIYDQAREKNKEQVKESEDDKDQESTALDYLTPVLRELQLENRHLSPSEALMVKNAVLNKLKKRLVHRCDIIQKSLDRERQQLQLRTNQFARKGDHVTAEEQAEYDNYVNEAQFRIGILDERAARHQMQALEKYAEMDLKLMNEPILQALHQLPKNLNQ